MISIVEFIISKIKKKDFQFDPEVGSRYILSLVFSQFISLLRGIVNLKKMVYVGRSCSFKARNKLAIGSNVRIGNNAYIDAISRGGIILGDNSKIGSYSFLIVSGAVSDLGNQIKIGNRVAIGEFSYIGGAGGVDIGRDTIIGQYFSVHPENHIFSDPVTLIREQGVVRRGINIGENCWIGAKVTILDGTKIGKGCVVAAGAVVSGIFPDNVVLGGVPAKILKYRV